MAEKIICVVGPTACGKTKLGVLLAKRYDGEVVSADSMQIYKGMTIGTAAPTAEEMEGVPHHMIAVADPAEQWSAARYARAAVPIVDDILRRGKRPILVGGTGLWLDAVVQGRTFAGGHAGGAVRRELQAQLAREGIGPLLEELRQVEELVNDAVLEGYPVVTEILPIEEAKKKGAVAMFGEKYGETVRVVEMSDFSVEFCGGTHVDNTAKAGPFRIKSESSVASGVRRIEATCGKLSLKAMESSQGVLSRAAQFLKTAPSGLLERMEQQANEMKQLRQALEKFKAEASLGEARQFLASAKTVKDLHVLATTRSGVDTAELRTMGDFLRDKDPKAVAVIASINGEKITFLAVCGKEAVARGIKAGDLVRHVSAICGGKGGGKPDSAMGGGSDPLKVDDALASVDDFVSEKLG